MSQWNPGQPMPPQRPQPVYGPPSKQAPPEAKDDNPLAAMFDFSFRRYATPGAVKVLYGLFFVILIIAAILAIIVLLNNGLGLHGVAMILMIVGIIIAPFLLLLLLRVLLEFAVATVRLSRNSAEMRDDLEEVKRRLAS